MPDEYISSSVIVLWSVVSHDAFVQFRSVMIVYDLLLVDILHSDHMIVLELVAYSQCLYNH